MKALVFHYPGKVSVDKVSDPKIEKSDDVTLRVTSTAICGSDLHIYNGFLPQAKDMISAINSWAWSRKSAGG